MADSDEDRDARQLPASERKLRQARERGQVPRSREAPHAAALLAMMLGLAFYGPAFAERSMALARGMLRFDPATAHDPLRAGELAGTTALQALLAVLPLLVLPLLAACAAILAVGGRVLSSHPVTPDVKRISPLAGIRRLFSVESVIDILKLAALASLVGLVGAWFVADGITRFAGYMSMSLTSALSGVAVDLRGGLLAACAVVVLAALVDAPVQVWRHQVRMRMSHQEARKEMRESDGDPLLKARIRERQRSISRGRMLEAVPRADVVVTNPTHFAVALKYDDAAGAAPRVVAKGADLLAARIREVAEQAGVPLLESPPLARALYRHVPIDQEIPATLYAAVAQVLAWVYQLRQHRAGRGAMPSDPGIELPAGLDPRGAES